MKKKYFLSFSLSAFFISVSTFSALGQFPGPAGTIGSTAIFKDSSVFVSWANACFIDRGAMDISAPGSGLASIGTEADAVGAANGSSVISLGDGGSAVLTFANPIMNGSGPDFAVFENSFSDQFLELAFVEVSSDGINFFRFPATSNIQDTTQIGPFGQQGDATKLNNLAGKYRGSYGTPFDLQELDGTQGLDVMHITHVKVIDVVGSINPLYASYDQHGNIINDPFPTAFASGGFDLDAVGVIHQSTTNDLPTLSELRARLLLFPNPAHSYITILDESNSIEKISIFSTTGEQLLETSESTIQLEFLPEGVYIVHIQTSLGIVADRFVKN